MKQTLEEAVNEIGGVHPDLKKEPDGRQNNFRGYQ